MMQYRLFGFLVSERESLEIINQNIKTTQNLIKCKSQKGTPFDFNKRKLKIGDWIDVKDTIDVWLEAEVIDVDEKENLVLVHYNGWGKRWDEYLPINSPRIAQFRTHTVQNGYSFYMSPVPQSPLDGDASKLKPLNVNLSQVMNDVNSQIAEISKMIKKLRELRNIQTEEEKEIKLKEKQIIMMKIREKTKQILNNRKTELLKQNDNLSVKFSEKMAQEESKSLNQQRINQIKDSDAKRELSPNSYKTNNSYHYSKEEEDENYIEIIEEEEDQSISMSMMNAKNHELLSKRRRKEIYQLAQ